MVFVELFICSCYDFLRAAPTTKTRRNLCMLVSHLKRVLSRTPRFELFEDKTVCITVYVCFSVAPIQQYNTYFQLLTVTI